MNTTETYEKVYFNDNYKERFEALRDHYRARTREALQGRKVDHAPVPNATTIVYLHEDPNGGTYVTTGDFVEYFNRRFGNNDRIGAARRSLAIAARKAESGREDDRRRADVTKKSAEKSFVPTRSARPRFAFFHAILALMLILAIGVWGGSTMLLDSAEERIMELEEQVTVLESSRDASNEAVQLEYEEDASESGEIPTYMSIGGENSVEIYPIDGVEMSGLLSIFAKIGK